MIRDYIYIEDLCNIVKLLIEKGYSHQVFNVGTGLGTSLNEIIQVLQKVTQTDFQVEYIQSRKTDVDKNILDTSAIQDYLHQQMPHTDLEAGIKSMWHWVQSVNQKQT
jgi:UDP-glucose 4-epimerase